MQEDSIHIYIVMWFNKFLEVHSRSVETKNGAEHETVSARISYWRRTSVLPELWVLRPMEPVEPVLLVLLVRGDVTPT